MKTSFKKALLYTGVLLFVLLSYLISRVLRLEQGTVRYVRYANLLFQISGVVILLRDCLRKKEKNTYTEEQITGLILSMGIFMRVVYLLYTPLTVRSHDLWGIDLSSGGHASYLLLAMQGMLPPDNYLQFYQQPLYYFAGAFFSKLQNGLLSCSEAYYLVDAARTVSCTASCFSLLIACAIFRECGLSGKGLYRALLLVSFLPVYFLSGGRLGPDALCGMFMLLAFLFTLKWEKEKSWKNTLLLAVIYGLGMMTKISMATLAVFTAVVFARSFFMACKTGTWKGLLLKYAVFGAISLPLGLWYSLRNYLLFRQPLTYVLEMSRDSALYTGDRSVWQRLFLWDIRNLFTTPYANVWTDYNLPVYALKSSLFGEFQFTCYGWIPAMLLFFNVVQALLSICAMVHYIKWKEKDRERNFCLLAAGILWMGTVFFYLRYPFGCSMDFRYMLFLPVPVAVLFGRWEAFHNGHTEAVQRLAGLWSIGFAISSCLMYG